jgi:[ribosomal protein S5]-alanine N-acetyltransferase
MEKMPFRPEMMRAATEGSPAAASVTASISVPAPEVTTSDWRNGLPVLTSARVTLRELRLEDAATLFSMLTTEEVARFISPPPTTVEGFELFIAWTIREREAGNYVCFGVVPEGMSTAVGLFQFRALEDGFRLGEWGFALGSGYWGTGIFVPSAKLVLDFAFDTIGIERLEARASVANGRGNGALRKIGAVQEGVLRRSFLRNGDYHDQVLWSLLAEEWRFQRVDRTALVH